MIVRMSSPGEGRARCFQFDTAALTGGASRVRWRARRLPSAISVKLGGRPQAAGTTEQSQT